MAKYTMELRRVIANDFEGYFKQSLEEYPIFSETHREILNNKIVNHYYMQEIGFETPYLFCFKLRAKMNEIMQYYNQLYKTELLNFDPLENANYKEDYSGDGTNKNDSELTSKNKFNSKTDGKGTDESHTSQTTDTDTTGKQNGETNTTRDSNDTNEQKTTTSETSNVKALRNDLPQGGLTKSDMFNQDYATESNQTDTTSNGETNTNGKATNKTTGKDTTKNDTESNQHQAFSGDTDSKSTNNIIVDSTNDTDNQAVQTGEFENRYNRVVKGWTGGSYSDELVKIRKNILNIDMLIVNDLRDLFMGLW